VRNSSALSRVGEARGDIPESNRDRRDERGISIGRRRDRGGPRDRCATCTSLDRVRAVILFSFRTFRRH